MSLCGVYNNSCRKAGETITPSCFQGNVPGMVGMGRSVYELSLLFICFLCFVLGQALLFVQTGAGGVVCPPCTVPLGAFIAEAI